MPMKSVSVTYKAPPGDSKVVEVFGHTFFDGKAETVTVDERVLAKLQGNQRFKCGEPTDAKETKEDPKAEEQAAKAAKAADDEKRAAQGFSPLLRGAQLNPLKHEPTDEETKEAKAEPAPQPVAPQSPPQASHK
jgi:hypothetical protein